MRGVALCNAGCYIYVMSTHTPDPNNIGRDIEYKLVMNNRDGTSRLVTRTARIVGVNSVIYRIEHTDITDPADRNYTGLMSSVAPLGLKFL